MWMSEQRYELHHTWGQREKHICVIKQAFKDRHRQGTVRTEIDEMDKKCNLM